MICPSGRAALARGVQTHWVSWSTRVSLSCGKSEVAVHNGVRRPRRIPITHHTVVCEYDLPQSRESVHSGITRRAAHILLVDTCVFVESCQK